MPALCKVGPHGIHIEECAFEGLGVCAVSLNLNKDVNGQGWVECTLCGQWVHTICMRVDGKKYGINDNFPCGCDALRSGCLPLKRYTFLFWLLQQAYLHGHELHYYSVKWFKYTFILFYIKYSWLFEVHAY